jgi:hypothetical protein
MNPRGIVVCFVAAVCTSCSRTSEAPVSLVGTFRTENPIKKERKPPLYYQFEFGEGGLSTFSAVEENGRVVNKPHFQEAFSLKEGKITFRSVEPINSAMLYDPPTLVYVSSDKLIFKDGGYVLRRIKVP